MGALRSVDFGLDVIFLHVGLRRFCSGRNMDCYVTKFAPQMAQTSVARGELTFDETTEFHRVDW